MAEPKYYDELPTYIMHSDGEFNEGVFKAVDGSGNSLTIGTEKSDTESKLTIEGAEKAEFDTAFEINESPVGTTKGAGFTATIGGIVFRILASIMSVGAQTIEGFSVIFEKDEDNIYFTIPTLNTVGEMVSALLTQVEGMIPKNIKDGEGNGAVIGGVVSGNHACEATGANSIAFGEWCGASGENSAAFNMSNAYGKYSFAGNNGTARGQDACAFGSCDADGYSSFAAGRAAYTEGRESVALNTGTTARGLSQTVIGKYNAKQGTEDSIQPTDNAFIIGNGTDNQHRSNALAVRWDGAIVLADGTVLTVEQLAKVANLT